MPWPARRSPHVDAAGSHSRARARRVGTVSDGEGGAEEAAWSPEEFDRLDFGLFAAYGHPDASGPELDLLRVS